MNETLKTIDVNEKYRLLITRWFSFANTSWQYNLYLQERSGFFPFYRWYDMDVVGNPIDSFEEAEEKAEQVKNTLLTKK